VIYSDRDAYDLLIFLAALLGMREYSKKVPNNFNDNKEKPVTGFKRKDSEIG
jgi:hypothetical protein